MFSPIFLRVYYQFSLIESGYVQFSLIETGYVLELDLPLGK